MTTADPQVILAAALARAPGLVPGWEPAPGSAGRALLEVAARFAGALGEAATQVPDRTRLAFLESTGLNLLPAQPARTPLVLTLLPNSPLGVTLPAGTQVAVAGGDGDPPAFATAETMTLTRARLAALYTVDPGTDRWTDHSADQAAGCVLFSAADQVEHGLYLGHDELFALSGTADVEVSVRLTRDAAPAGPDLAFTWEYLGTAGWLPMRVLGDSTGRLIRSGSVRLRKAGGPDAMRAALDGHESHWIRARTTTAPIAVQILAVPAGGGGSRIEVDGSGHLRAGDEVTVNGADRAVVVDVQDGRVELSGPLVGLTPGRDLRSTRRPDPLTPLGADPVRVPALDDLRVRAAFTHTGIVPEAVLAAGLPADVHGSFAPFGAQPATLATFHVASQEAFSHPGAEVGLRLAFLRPGRPDPTAGVPPLSLDVEYHDGTTWRDLTGFALADGTDRFTQDGELVFIAPRDWAPVEVDGDRQYWVRIRIRTGGYGSPAGVRPDPTDNSKVVLTPDTLQPPVVASLGLRFSLRTDRSPLDHCLTLNDFRFTDRTQDALWPGRELEPFTPGTDLRPAVHLGFDQPLPAGLVSLFILLPDTGVAAGGDASSDYAWEYASARGWSPLGVLDDTGGFRRSGTIRFSGPPDAVPVDGVGGVLHRVRARLKRGTVPEPIALQGVWLNGGWALQQRTVAGTTLGTGDGTPRQSLRFPPQDTPVLEGEVVEVREWTGTGEGWRSAVVGLTEPDVRFEDDPLTGAHRAVWVRYRRRDHLQGSGVRDRHYTLERSAGLVQFGDRRHGAMPPPGSEIRATYATGGGAGGNVAAGTVTELRSAAPFVASVTNVAAAAGGADTEPVAAAAERGAARLRHRDRAVTSEDVEWLALEASPAVARARCVPLLGAEGPGMPGRLTVVVAAGGTQPMPHATPELLRRVEEHLATRVPAAVAGRVRVVAASYTVVRVVAGVVPAGPAAAADVEARLRRRADAYLNPTYGGSSGRGWAFGEPVFQSALAALLERTEGVDHVVDLALELDGSPVAEIGDVPVDRLVAPGDHEIRVVVAEGAPG